MVVMVMLYTTVLSTKMRNADGRSGHGGGEAEGQWIYLSLDKSMSTEAKFSRHFAKRIDGNSCGPMYDEKILM